MGVTNFQNGIAVDRGDSTAALTIDGVDLVATATQLNSIALGQGGLKVHNATGGTLTRDTLVYINGENVTTGLPTVAKADGNGADTLPLGFLTAAIADGADGYVARNGLSVATLNTNAGNAGDPVYLSDTAGGWSLSVGTSKFVIGYVVVKSATVGQILWVVPRPVQSAYAGAAVVTTAATQSTPYGFATQAQADNLVAMVNSIRAAMIATGQMASS